MCCKHITKSGRLKSSLAQLLGYCRRGGYKTRCVRHTLRVALVIRCEAIASMNPLMSIQDCERRLLPARLTTHSLVSVDHVSSSAPENLFRRNAPIYPYMQAHIYIAVCSCSVRLSLDAMFAESRMAAKGNWKRIFVDLGVVPLWPETIVPPDLVASHSSDLIYMCSSNRLGVLNPLRDEHSGSEYPMCLFCG